MNHTLSKSSMDIYFIIFIILILFFGESIQNYLNIKDGNSLIEQCFKLPYIFLYISLFKRAKHLKLTKIDKYLLFILGFAIFISIFLLNKRASLGMFWQLIVIPLLLSGYLNTFIKRTYLRLRPIIVMFFIVECLIAIYEGYTQNILIDTGYDYLLDGLGDFRAHSLHGHGLQNSFIIIVIGVGILFSDYSYIIKYSLFLLGCGAIMAFNTRSGFYIYIGIFIVHLLYTIIFTEKLNIRKRILIIGISILLLFLIPIFISDLNLGTRLFINSQNDGGSTNIRIATFNFLFSQSILDIIIGLPSNYTANFLKRTGYVAIENSFLIILFQNGLLFLITYIYLIYKKISGIIVNRFILFVFCGMLIALYNVNNIIATPAPSMIIVFIVIYTFIIPQESKTN